MALFSRFKKFFSSDEETPKDLESDAENGSSGVSEDGVEPDSASDERADGASGEDESAGVNASSEPEADGRPEENASEAKPDPTGDIAERTEPETPILEEETPDDAVIPAETDSCRPEETVAPETDEQNDPEARKTAEPEETRKAAEKTETDREEKQRDEPEPDKTGDDSPLPAEDARAEADEPCSGQTPEAGDRESGDETGTVPEDGNADNAPEDARSSEEAVGEEKTGENAAEASAEQEQEQESFFSRVFKSLARTRKRLAARLLSLFGASKIDDAFWDELEEILISADVGMEPTMELTKRLKARLREEGILNPAEVPPYLHREIAAVFAPVREAEPASPQVALVIGVNGVGKTTTIAKLAHMEKKRGKKVLIAAADTFRAAAVEQLETWAKRVGCRFYAKGQGADPAAVAYEALDVAQKENVDIVFVDTAGRLHTKTNLMEELLKIRRVLNKRMPGAPHRSILVMDATTGQNGLSQAKLFGESCGIDELILTKLDGTAKGGIAVAIAMQFGIPISHVGLGEGMRDLRPFEPETFTKALLDTKE